MNSASRPTALVVDDEASVCTTLRILLELRGFDSVLARSGAEALAAFEKHRGFRFVITDFSMPGMNGVDLAVALKARAPGQPVLLLTAYAAQLEPEKLPAVDVVLEKPISMVKLDEVMETIAC